MHLHLCIVRAEQPGALKATAMRFNIFNRKKAVPVVNHEGVPAYRLTPELELYAAVVTASLGNRFYEGAGERISRIRTLIPKVDPLFVARLAVYTREKMHLRSVPVVLGVELAKVHSGDQLVSRMIAR